MLAPSRINTSVQAGWFETQAVCSAVAPSWEIMPALREIMQVLPSLATNQGEKAVHIQYLGDQWVPHWLVKLR